jgi:hypothetical protein
MADAPSLWAARNKLQDLKDQFEATQGLTVIDVDHRAIVPYPHGER